MCDCTAGYYNGECIECGEQAESVECAEFEPTEWMADDPLCLNG